MKYIITGGSGLVGRELTDSLQSDGHQVVILSRSPEQVKITSENVRAVQWDGKTSIGWQSEVEDADVIVNLAGESIGGTSLLNMRWTKARRERILESRLNAGRAVVEAIRQAKNKPELLIQASAVGVYGPRGDEMIAEDAQPSDDFLANVVVDWEATTDEVETLGVRRVVVRTGVVLHRDNLAFKMLVLPFKLFAGGPLGSGKQYTPWIHYADLIRAFVFFAENKNLVGVYNLTIPETVNNKSLAQILGKLLKRPSFIPLPGFVLKLGLGEVATVVLDGQRVIPERLQKAGFEYIYPTVESAFRNLL